MKIRIPGPTLIGAWWLFLLTIPIPLLAADADIASLRAKAQNGNVLAQYNLGLAYADGSGGSRDLIEAYVWLRLAVENGGTGTALGGLIHQMSSDEIEAGRLRFEERRRTVPSVVVGRRGSVSASMAVRPAGVAPPAPTEDRFAVMQEELAVLKVNNARLTQQLASRPAPPADLKKVADLGPQLEAARKELVQAHADRETLAGRLAEQERTAAGFPKQLAEAQAAVDQLKKTNAELEARCTELAGRLAAAPPPVTAPTVTAPAVSPPPVIPPTAPAPTATAAPADSGGVDEMARLKEELNREKAKVEMTVRSFTLLREENERLKAQVAPPKAP